MEVFFPPSGKIRDEMFRNPLRLAFFSPRDREERS